MSLCHGSFPYIGNVWTEMARDLSVKEGLVIYEDLIKKSENLAEIISRNYIV